MMPMMPSQPKPPTSGLAIASLVTGICALLCGAGSWVCCFLVFLAAGSALAGLWVGIVLMGLFTFAESPQLQTLLADIAPPSVRDASFAVYFTLAFGIGSLWNAVYGVVLDVTGDTVGVPAVFVLMAITFLLAALATLPIRATPHVVDEPAVEAA